MKNVAQKLSLILAILLLTSTVAIYLPSVAAADAVISTSPDPVEKTSADYGKTFNLSIVINNVTNLYGFDFNITWDDTLISCSSCDVSSLDLIWSGINKWYEVDRRNGTGWFKYAATSLDKPGYTLNPGNHELFKITFRVKGPFCNSVRETTIGFATHKLSNSDPAPITHTVDEGLYRITGKKPTLSISPTNPMCRKYGQPFSATISISDAESVLGLEFDIRFNTTLLNYTSVAWDAWASGSMVSDEAGGKLTGSTSGSAKNGSLTLLTITFKAACLHIWKDDATMSWKSNQTGTIFFQAANLTYTIAPKLRYVKGGLSEITVTPVDVNYKFAPIKGDLNNDGEVELSDLVTLCHHYDVKEGDAGWTEAQPWDLIYFGEPKIIDIFDVIVISSNYGYKYIP